jgi:hypothetical protein
MKGDQSSPCSARTTRTRGASLAVHALAERCQTCRRVWRSAAECEKRHTEDFAAAQAGAKASEECKGLEGTDSAARSLDGSMASPNKEIEKVQQVSEKCATVLRKKGATCAACRWAHRSDQQCAQGACKARLARCEACRRARKYAAE